MFRKSLWFAIVMSLFVVGANFVDAKGASSGGGFSGGGRASVSSGGFTGGSRATVTAPITSTFTGGNKATAPTGFVGGNKSETPTGSVAAPSGKTDMMSKSVQQERSNNVYGATDKPAVASGTSTSSTANAGGLPPSVIGGQTTVVKETTVIRDRSSGPSWFPVPIFLGGGGSDHTTIINNGQPGQMQSYDNSEPIGARQSGRGWSIFFFIIGVSLIAVVIISVVRKNR